MSNGERAYLLPPLANRTSHQVRAQVIPKLPVFGYLPTYPHGKPVAIEIQLLCRQTSDGFQTNPDPEAFLSMDLATSYRLALKRHLPAMEPRNVRNEASAAFMTAKSLGLLDAINWFLGWHRVHILGHPVADRQTFLPDVCTTHPAVPSLHKPTQVEAQRLEDLVFILPSIAEQVRWTGRQWLLSTAIQARDAEHAGDRTGRFATPGPCPPELVSHLPVERIRALDEWADGKFSSRERAHVVDSEQVTDVPLPGALRACSWTLLEREPLAWVTDPDPRYIPQRFIYEVTTTIAHSHSEHLVTSEFHVSSDNALAAAPREAKELVEQKYPHLVHSRLAGSATPQVFQ